MAGRTRRRAAVLGVRLAGRPGAGAARARPTRMRCRPACARLRRRMRHRRHCLCAGWRSMGRRSRDRPAGACRNRAERRDERCRYRTQRFRHRRHRRRLGPHPVRRRLLRGADDRAYSAVAAAHGRPCGGVDRRSRPRLSAAAPASPPSPAIACRPAWNSRIGPSGWSRSTGSAVDPASQSACRRCPIAKDPARSLSTTGRRSRCSIRAARRPAWPARAT